MFTLLSDTYNVQTKRALLQDSLTFKVGDVVIPVSGATTDNIITNTSATVGDVYNLGVLIGFSKVNGEVISQGQDPLYTPNQLTTGATNVSAIHYYGVYIPIHEEQEWLADLDAVSGTTSGSNLPYCWFNLADARTIDESSIVAAGGTKGQFLSLGVSPESTSKIIGKFGKYLLGQ
jgi:hypothetical protein